MARIEGPRIPPTGGAQDPNQQYLLNLISLINKYIQSGGQSGELDDISKGLAILNLPTQMQKTLQQDLQNLGSAADPESALKQAGLFLCDASLDYIKQKYPLSPIAPAPANLTSLIEMARANIYNLHKDADPIQVFTFIAEAQWQSAQVFPGLTSKQLAAIHSSYEDLMDLPTESPEAYEYFQDFQNTLPSPN